MAHFNRDLFTAVIFGSLIGPTITSAGELTVYTALESDQLAAYSAKIREDYPDLKIKWVRDSTGVITARLLAEQKNPKADVVVGLAVTSLMLLDQKNMLHPYAPVGVEKLNKQFVSTKKIPTWTGMDAWESALCVR